MTLTPAKSSATKGAVFCLFQIMFGRLFMAAGDLDMPYLYWIGLAWVLVFVAFLGRIGFAFFMQKPSFQADNAGFSVMGKAQRPWSDYHGAQVKAIRVYFIPIISWVVVKTGRGMLGSSQSIQWGCLSDKPRKMAEKMNSFARKQQMHGN